MTNGEKEQTLESGLMKNPPGASPTLGAMAFEDEAALGGAAGLVPISNEDRPILAAIASGDLRTALSLCAHLHGRALGRLCMALVGSQAEADDLIQETLLTAHDGFAGYRGEGSVRGWLLGIARRKCAHAVERRVRRDKKLRLALESDHPPPTDELLGRRRRAEQARAALDAVRPTEREALVLRYVGELSYQEVGRACGIDEAAARKRVSRAIARLRAALAEDE